MGKYREGWYERNENQKVSLNTIELNCNLTEREFELLQLIYDRKLIRRDLLEIISPSYRSAGDNRTIILNRSIKKMYKNMILDKIHEVQKIGKGNTPCIVSLDKGGSIILGVSHKKRIIHDTHFNNGLKYINRRLPSNYNHIHGVNTLEAETIIFAEQTDNHLLQWRHEVSTIFKYNNEDILFIPDVFMELRFSRTNFLSFIEYDTGKEDKRNKKDFPTISNKLINYKKYKMSNLWENDYKYFPMILFVTNDNKRIPYVNNKFRELGLQGIGVYIDNYRNVLERLAIMG